MEEEVEELDCLKCRGVQPHWIVRRYAKCLNCERVRLAKVKVLEE